MRDKPTHLPTTKRGGHLEIMKNLFQLVSEINGCKIAHIEYNGTEKCPKGLGLGGVVTKVVRGDVQVNFSYENAVNNRLQKQGDTPTFVSGSLPYGSWVVPNKIFIHKGEHYLRFYALKGSVMTTEYFVNGKAATQQEVAIIKAWKKSQNKTSDKQAAYGLTENQVCPRNIKFANIISFKCGDINYDAKQNAAA